jgi:hypothetical protein
MQRPDPRSVTAPEDWCTSCWRDNHNDTRVTRRDGGRGAPYYAGLCKWCGDFKAEHGQVPPMALVRAHHVGRVPKALHDKYMPTTRRTA